MPRKSKKQTQLFGDQERGFEMPALDASLTEETQRRYLHYALSVITSRALPDARDGLKPVQRRILYTMHRDLHLRHDVKHRKSAAIVGEVMGKYHPHGDTAIYDALVRLAQPFSLRQPLVDGRGNFGSADGDSAAAMRYTEARLQRLSSELLEELGQQTVPFRPTYDGTRFEPVVLPARFPNLLVNGSQGIAVGMATSIPPHNLGEVIDACIALIDTPGLEVKQLLKHVKGPDFPTGGALLTSKSDLQTIYETGQGSLKLRGEWKLDEPKRGEPKRGANTQLVLYSMPYGFERRTIVEKIAEVILARKLPTLLDVRDESTDETRVVLEIKKDADPQLVMAYLYKHTPLATNVQVNLTCLVPTDHPDITAPARLNLHEMLDHFLRFRMEVVVKRLEYQLAELLKRIHVLEGFEKIFDALDETIRIIRRSEGRKDAAEKLMRRFELDQEQVDAILELRLYKLARLEILIIRKELEEKRKEAKRIEALLESDESRWKLIRAELLELKTSYQDPRRTKLRASTPEPEYDAEAFIVDEDAMVLITQQGWIKRQREVKDVSSTRVREGDRVLDVIAGSTKSTVAFFSNQGSCYVCRVVDVPATTGHGVPIQKLFKLADGERIVRMLGFDPRMLDTPPPSEGAEVPEPPYALAVTRSGYSLQFSLRAHRDPSTRSGRKYARLIPGDEVIYVQASDVGENVACASQSGHALIASVEDISLLGGPGKGVMLMKLGQDDVLIAARILERPSDALIVKHQSGRTFSISTRGHQVATRGGKGHALFKRGKLVEAAATEPTVPDLGEPGA